MNILIINMVMVRLFFNIVLFAIISCPVLAAEAPPPFELKGIYEFEFAGTPFARMGIEAEQTAGHYSMTSDIVSVGILKLFTQHSSHTTVDANGAEFRYPDIIYETHYQTRKKKRYVKLVYKNGVINEEKVVPPDNRDKRPAVSATMKKGAVDLLSLNLRIREKLWQALKNGEERFSLNTYDGRRLTRVDVALAGHKKIRIGEKNLSTVRVAVRRTLLAGYTDSEKADYNPKEPTLWMFFSDDNRLIPIRVELGFLFSKIAGTLAKECRTGESCLLGIKE